MFLHSGSQSPVHPRLLFSLRMRSPCSLSRSAVYHLNFSPKNSGLVVFVLYPCGGGAPVGCGSARRLFLAPHSHELHVYSAPWSFLSISQGGGVY